ncbi:MAG: RsmB/NOP family class I SAM-dependent RNA methyltransferase [Ignavibacteriales bacterium]|nr:RsmB/NOP family class I SAM-dependent RNA methyltransferase [Ignavibacteriales bacterium]
MQLVSLIGHTQEVLQLIRSSDKPADSVIDSFFRSRKYLGSHDRRFISETSYGTLRHLRWCDDTLKKTVGSGFSISPKDAVLLLVLTYLLGIEKRRDISSELLGKNVSNGLSRKKLDEIIAAIQKKDETLEKGDGSIGLHYSFQDWMVQKFVEKFGQAEAEVLCKKLNEQAPITLRVNTIKATVDECRDRLLKEGIEAEPVAGIPNALTLKKRVNVFGLNSFKEGLFELQDAGSQLLPIMIDPKPTAKVLDACAGAGGKTLQFAALMKNRGEIVATDINRLRMEELKKRARRAGAFNIRPKHVNSLVELGKDYAEYFDVVFADAPCTGVGTIRRNPGIKWSVSEEMVKELSEKQLSILQSCAPLVKKGGRLVYATCSLFDEENEQVVERFLKEESRFSRKNLLNTLEGKSSDFIYLLPHKHGTDGFFVSVLESSQ